MIEWELLARMIRRCPLPVDVWTPMQRTGVDLQETLGYRPELWIWQLTSVGTIAKQSMLVKVEPQQTSNQLTAIESAVCDSINIDSILAISRTSNNHTAFLLPACKQQP